jgi:uncharacterized protein YkwD
VVAVDADLTAMAVEWRRGLAFLTIALTAVIASVMPAVAAQSDEAEFVALINQTRAASGLGPLASYDDLVDDARRHSAQMIAAGKIYHSTSAELSSYTTGWTQVGENVGMGPNPSILHTAFMSSPSHKANILGDYDRVGVGTDRASDGTMFVTVLFMKSAPAPATTTTTAPPPTTAPPATTATTAAPAQVLPVLFVPDDADTTPAEAPAPVDHPGGLEAAWIELEAQTGAYCVVVRVDGSVCVE